MGSSDTDEFEPPAWLDSEFITKTLLNEEESILNITRIDIKPAVPKGENFLGTLYRVAVEYENRNGMLTNKYLIVKTIPDTEDAKAFLTQVKAIDKELLMYGTVLPIMNNIMKTTEGKVSPFSALLFQTDRPETIVLEDLKYLGYEMADRLTGLNLDHCLVTMRKLARFHAFSRKLYNTNPEIFDAFREGLFSRNEANHELLHPYFKSKFDDLASEIETWPSFEHYSDKIRKLGDKAYDLMIDSTIPTENSFNVLNHGDFWANNIVFRYDPQTGKVEDARFVDFQLSAISSPSMDLQYFVTTSTADVIRFDQRETLLEEYHAELIKTMEILNLNSDQFTLSQLKEDFENKDIFGLITACVDLSDMVDKKFGSQDDPECEPYYKKNVGTDMCPEQVSRKRFREIFQKMLIYYDKKGVLRRT